MAYFENLIIGGGPAGTGPILKAMKDGTIADLLNLGVAIIEKSDNLLKGTISNYQIHSDTLSDAFLECLEGLTSNYIDYSELQNEIEFIAEYKGKSIPLNSLDRFLTKLGSLLFQLIDSHPKCRVFLNSEAIKVISYEEGAFDIYMKDHPEPVRSRKIILACGGKNIGLNDIRDNYGDRLSLREFETKTVRSDELLTGNLKNALSKILAKHDPKIVILGSSHSAFSAAYYLLNHFDAAPFSKESIRVYCNNKPKIFFGSRAEALAVNYTDFTDDDFCPVTQRLYRLAGLRMKSRDLFMAMEGMMPGPVEDRVVLKYNTEGDNIIRNDLKDADLIILALGYTFNCVNITDKDNHPLQLQGILNGRWVDNTCALVDTDGKVIPNIFAVGLASGFIPGGKLGGEPSFRGQTNGIWYYQNIIGQLILDKMLLTEGADVIKTN